MKCLNSVWGNEIDKVLLTPSAEVSISHMLIILLVDCVPKDFDCLTVRYSLLKP